VHVLSPNTPLTPGTCSTQQGLLCASRVGP
jgi:hypothetical protein